MTFKLTKTEEEQRSAIVEKLRLEASKLEDSVCEFNEALSVARDRLDVARQAYNSILEEARTFVGEVQGRLTDEYDEKSDKWKEGERGTEVEAWIEEWTDATGDTFADVEFDMPDGIDAQQIDDADTLENLDAEPS